MDQTKQNVVGAYALVTGSGAGLGLAFAKELASRGYNLVMVSLPGESLEQKALQISKEHRVEVMFLEKDLSDEQSSADIAQ
jgi:short-subunit dehydrogenase